MGTNNEDDLNDDGSRYIVDLAPYRVQDINRFYHRDHPVQLHPQSPAYKKYWLKELKHYVEGRWVLDTKGSGSKGVWYWIPPKLDFYINYLTLEDEKRNVIVPTMRDIDRIIFRYITCMDGFSGFEEDHKYTCNELVRKIEEGVATKIDLKKITPSCYIPGTKDFKKYINPWEYLRTHYLIDEPCEKPMGRALWENQLYNAMVLAARFTGKALKPTEKVRVPGGWREIGQLRVGDKVFGGSGKLANVTDVFPDQKDLNFYRITLANGKFIDACADHQWKVWNPDLSNGVGQPRGRYEVKNTISLLKNYKRVRLDNGMQEYKYSLPICGEVDEAPIDNYIHPYIVGILLGDGCLYRSQVDFTSADTEIAKTVLDLLPDGYYLETTEKSGTDALNYIILGEDEAGKNFRHYIGEMGLIGTKSNSKFIPDTYLNSSIEARFELLRGLMDSDGYSNGLGYCEYTTVSKQLSEDVTYLIEGLGMYTSMSDKIGSYVKDGVRTMCQKAYRISIITGKDIFKLDRKRKYLNNKISKRTQNKSIRIPIHGIEYIGKSDGVCIKVDNEDHTFITKNHIVTHNSSSVFVGDFMHEWFFCGVRCFEDLPKVNRRYLFSMSSADSAPLRRSISLISSNMSRLPGKYKFATDNGNRIPDYMGPMYKNFVGTWRPGSDVTHIEKDRGGRVSHTGAMCQMRVLTPDKTSIVAGDRFRRIIVEEVGFLEKIMEIWANAKDSLRQGMYRVGSFIGLGTSGELVAFRQSYELFNNPDTYDIFGVPDYWNNTNKKIGLFIPSYYTDRDYADENENQDIVEAFKAKMQYRAEQREKASSMSYDKEVMFHPVEPREMMRPSGISVLPRQEAQEQLNNLETHNIYKNISVCGDLKWNLARARGVEFQVDLENKLHPITTYSTTNLPNLYGAVTLYEQPMTNPPQKLYYVLYDPAAQSGEGTSLHSILVYKYFHKGSEGGLEDSIVAEWLGRLDTLEQNWSKVIQMAKFFNATILAETNTPGFIDWCKKENHFHLLQSENMALKKELNPKAKSTYYKKGFRMGKREKGWALNKLKDWLLEVKLTDGNGVPLQRTIDTIYSPRILEEIVHYELDGNYDHVSSLLGLMFLQNQLDGMDEIMVKDEFSDEEYFYTQEEEYENITPYTRMARSKFVNY